MIRTNARMLALGLGLSVVAAGCDSATGTRAETRVQLSRSASSTAALLAEGLLLDAGVATNVDMADVQSIEVTISRVQAIPGTEDPEAESGWISLDVSSETRVNLLALPVATEGGIDVARGELPAGTYRNLRFFVDSATVTFARDVAVAGGPNARTYEAGTAHPLRIPSVAQAGIRVPGESFTVAGDAGADVTVLFESAASVRSIQSTGTGLQMSPVLNARSR